MNKNKEKKKIIICYFGFYEPNASRDEVYIDGLKRNGIKVIECNDCFKSKLLKYWRGRINFQIEKKTTFNIY